MAEGHTKPLTSEYYVAVSTQDTVIAPGNRRRIGMLIGAPPSATIYLRFGGPMTATEGLPIYPGGQPLYLDQIHVGDALEREVHCVSPSGTQNIYVFDVFLV